MRSPRNHRGYWAFIGHRVSGLLLAVFLPLHFLALGLALEGAARFDRFLVFAELPLVKVAEWSLVLLLTIHMAFGLRLLVLEFLPWRDPRDARLGWVGWGTGLAMVVGVAFLMGVF
ncbi:succinate dehydrogenase cytochrome b-556 subunit [Bordetella ansorpii]|uniref:Succinate dehydrogenase cytochrome b-556 subunit n=1 Tax=Bordetella ansorpii TaxID=288768 RepID=A0A157MEQ4_9BORD|nr:succinate dehydrogenase [Bordetella ansorpii]SAI07458.1 succinate dehydrogenase cytochrome b-556 subunit [Bordetella ansorpii]